MNPAQYAQTKADRAKHGDAILASTAAKKLVVAGPGTGKTHLFKRVLDGKKNTVTLSFVNSLVADLALELCGLSDVRTLHSFARSVLAQTLKKEIKIDPNLSSVVKADAKILFNQDIDFDEIFHKRDDQNAHIPFYKLRKDYYGYHGYADIVYAAARYFEAHPEKIPAFEQVVVDEFQDFNNLEVSLIDLLAQKSPVLLAGDDDQALYAFKHASADHIRKRHTDPNHGYSAFNLPYCSRCTRVIVDAANDIVAAAHANGNLVGRINKPYLYFDDADKDIESATYPYLVHARLQAAQIPWFICREMGEIAKDVRRSFTVLVISPTKVQSRTIVNGLWKKGLKNIDFVDRTDNTGPTLLDGLKLLLAPKQGFSNFGWRIAAKHLLTEKQLGTVVEESAKDLTQSLHGLLPKPAKLEIAGLLKTLRSLQNGEKISDENLNKLIQKTGIDARALAIAVLKEKIAEESRGGNPCIKTIPIKATTIQSSKGLAADYVFITHFDNSYFIKDGDKTKISDQDVCNLLVALTRARKKVYLVSSNPIVVPSFRSWIKSERVVEVVLDQM